MSTPRTNAGLLGRANRTELASAAAAIAAVFAPANLTGATVIDGVERFLIAGFVTYVGSHGRRWAWLTAAAAITLSARGISLALALASLLIIAFAAVPKRRRRDLGALGLGLLVNAVFWYPEETSAWGVGLAAAGMVLVVLSGLPHLRPAKRGFARTALLVMAVGVVAAGCLAAVAVGLSYQNVQSGSSAARDALASARDGDGPSAAADLATAQTEFEQASARVNGPLALPARVVPGLAQQVIAVQTTVDQGTSVADTADDLVATADYDTLTYDGRLDLAQAAALAAPTSRVDRALSEARTQLDRVRQGALLPPLQDRVDQFADQIDEARSDTTLAADLLAVTPDLFGASGPRTYLILFLTPAELRGAGGFVGSYAQLDIIDGKASLTRSGRINELLTGPNRGSRTISGPADYLKRYGRFDPGEYLQDVTQSPHFPSSASVMAELYPQAGGVPVDGVIAVDPTGLAALLELTGPVTVDGLPEPLSADNAVDLLTRRQYLEFDDRAERGDILAAATKATFEKLVSSSLPAPRQLANTLSPAARAGHLRLWSPVEQEQALFKRLGATGDLEIPTGADGFSVVQQNAGNNKIDAYLQRNITYLPRVDPVTGALEAELTIELHNDVPFAELPEYVVGNTRGVPLGTNLASLSVFTRHRVTEASIDGEPVTLGPGSERGLHAWDTPLLQIPPGGTVTVTMELAGSVDLRRGYQLTILPQPVVNPDRFTSTLTVTDGGDADTDGSKEALLDDEPLVAPTRIRVPVPR